MNRPSSTFVVLEVVSSEFAGAFWSPLALGEKVQLGCENGATGVHVDHLSVLSLETDNTILQVGTRAVPNCR